MAGLLTKGNKSSGSSSSSASVRPNVNIVRVRVRSVDWNQIERQVSDNTNKIANLESITEELDNRVSANEESIGEITNLMETKVIFFKDLGD